MLVVALLTCDRWEMTYRTVESLLRYNDVSGWALRHADDHSRDPRIAEYLANRGFRTVFANTGDRIGVTRMTATMFDRIGDEFSSDTHLLYLQDDWESRRPIPLAAVTSCLDRPEIGWVRLFYARRKRRTMRQLPGEVIGGETVVTGDFDYSDQPHITRLGLARTVFDTAHTEGGVLRNAQGAGLRVAFVRPPVMVHIGRNRPVRGSRHGIPRALRAEYLRRDGLIETVGKP